MIAFDLVALFVLLQAPESRIEGADSLARYCGVDDIVLFGKDQEIGLFLPAPGMPQTLREGARWQTYLQACAREGQWSAAMPDPHGGAETGAFGMTDPKGTAALVFLGSLQAPRHCHEIAALLPLLGASLALERTVLAADGHAAAARESSRRAGALNAALDVNRRELQKAYQLAERELESRRAAEQKLREADRRKDEFLAMLAHELRNPLAPISMAAQILKIDSSNPVRLQQTCEIINRQVTHMTCLLDDLLDVSRVTGGMVALAQEQVDMRHIVEQALEQARPLINARGHHLTVNLAHAGAMVSGDGTRLVQIVTNLLNNASKYTPEGGDIALQLALRADHVVLTVRDNGIGIGPALLPHVFDLFTQGERSSDRTQGGLGLGLALVKSLAERHGGTVGARSAGQGCGSEFKVTLPRVQPVPAGRRATPELACAGGRGLSVLIVDDNEDAARTLALFLQAHGHRVQIGFDGATALARAALEAPQVLLLDIGLPDMDGCTLAGKLRALPAMEDSIYIALTGYGRPEDRARSSAAGFDHHLTKPVDASELARLLGSISARHLPPPAPAPKAGSGTGLR